MAEILSNQPVAGTLASGITSGATTATLTTGHGAGRGYPTTGTYRVAIYDPSSGANYEIATVASRSGDVLTFAARGQEGTTAAAHNAGDVVDLGLTAGALAAAFVSATGGAVYDTGGAVRNVRAAAYGAKADVVTLTGNGASAGASITSGAATLTTSSAQFTSTAVDAGKVVVVAGAGAAGADLVTTISTVTNSTTAVLATNAGTTVSFATLHWGTDDTAAIEAALNAGSGVTAFVPPGRYFVSGVDVPANRRLMGAGFTGTYLIPFGNADGVAVGTASMSSADRIFNVAVADLAIYPLRDQTAGAALHLGNVGSLAVRNVKIGSGLGGKPYDGVRIDAVADSTFEQVWVTGVVRDGVVYDPPVDGAGYVGRTVETFWLDGCKINACGRYGVYLRMAQTYGVGTGTGSGTLEGVHLMGVSTYGNASGACRVETTTAAARIRNVHLDGTILDTSTAGAGLYLGGAAGLIENVVVANPWASANGGAGAHGIYVGSVVTECLIDGGTVQFNDLDGIRVDGAARTKIVGTKVWNNSQAATGVSYGVAVTGAATDTWVDVVASNTGAATNKQNGLLVDAATADTDYQGYYATGAGTTPISVNASATRARSGVVIEDAAQAYLAIKSQVRAAGLIVDTSTSGTAATLRLTDALGTSHKYLRLSGSTLQILNSAASALIWSLDNGGSQSHLQQTLGSAVLSLSSVATNDDPNYVVYQARAATTDATVTTLHTVAVAASTTYLIEARVVARRTGGASGTADDGAVYVRRAMVTTKAGTVTINAVDGNLTQEDQAGWDCTLTVSSTNVLVRVTGAASNNVTWHGTIVVQNLST